MIYLESFQFPSPEMEDDFLVSYHAADPYATQSNYPFGVLWLKGLQYLDFSEITVLYGGNGATIRPVVE